MLDGDLAVDTNSMRQARHGRPHQEIQSIDGILQFDPFVCRKTGLNTPTTDREKFFPSLHIRIE